ncbi:MAG: PEP/pyruvate-binding domain-containing protein, partial [Thermoleophilia bacterium]
MTATTQNPSTLALGDAASAPVALVGGKARSLGRLLDRGLPAPDGLVITTAAYRTFVGSHGLAERIAVELARKPESEYRWEELWDAALRIRAWFLGNPWPAGLRDDLVAALAGLPGDGPVVVRSSSPHEDAKERSFAGMHESVVGVAGTERILDAVRTVWASLFSDRSLLYRGELGLDHARSAMAVV